MSASNIKVTTLRAPSAVSQEGAGRRIASARRYAISANRKRRLGDGRFDVVEVWTLKERIDGRVRVVKTNVSEQYARAWVAEGARAIEPDWRAIVQRLVIAVEAADSLRELRNGLSMNMARAALTTGGDANGEP